MQVNDHFFYKNELKTKPNLIITMIRKPNACNGNNHKYFWYKFLVHLNQQFSLLFIFQDT